MVGRPVCLGVKLHLGPKTRFLLLSVMGLLTWSSLSDRRMGLSFTIAAGPHQCSHSWVWVQEDSWPYFTISELRLLTNYQLHWPSLHSLGKDCIENMLSWFLFLHVYSLSQQCAYHAVGLATAAYFLFHYSGFQPSYHNILLLVHMSSIKVFPKLLKSSDHLSIPFWSWATLFITHSYIIYVVIWSHGLFIF
jgi:hypothetical protein